MEAKLDPRHSGGEPFTEIITGYPYPRYLTRLKRTAIISCQSTATFVALESFFSKPARSNAVN